MIVHNDESLTMLPEATSLKARMLKLQALHDRHACGLVDPAACRQEYESLPAPAAAPLHDFTRLKQFGHR